MTAFLEPPAFDVVKLDRLMAEHEVDVLLACSKHNTRYLLGGHYSRFFRHFDAVGVSRYLPIVGYVDGRIEDGFYVGSPLEIDECDVAPIWPRTSMLNSWTSRESARAAAQLVKERSGDHPRVAIERSFVPSDAMDVLASDLPGATFTDAREILDELRAIKTNVELDLIRRASSGVVDAMLATFHGVPLDASKIDIDRRYRCELAERGLTYEYALLTVGTELNRAASLSKWQEGDLLSLDSGAEFAGYIGDLCRMAVRGTPTARMIEVLAQVEALQVAARRAIRPGEVGQAIYDSALAELAALPDRPQALFLAHGMGLTSHEIPRLTSSAAVPYEGRDAGRALEPGMVLSIESQILDPEVGFVKLEETVIVTTDGVEVPADIGRDWNIVTSSITQPLVPAGSMGV